MTTWSCSTGAPTACTCRWIRSRRSPPTAAASRRRCRRWAVPTGSGPGPRPVPRPARWPPSWCSCTGAVWRWRGGRSAPTRRGRPRWSRRSGSSRPRTSSRPSQTSSATWKSRGRWTVSCAATSGSARRRWPCAPSSRRCRTGRRQRCWLRRPCWRASTPRPSRTATRPTRCGWSCSAVSCRRPNSEPSSRAWPTGASTWSSARTGCWPRTCSSRSSVSSWSTRSSASA